MGTPWVVIRWKGFQMSAEKMALSANRVTKKLLGHFVRNQPFISDTYRISKLYNFKIKKFNQSVYANFVSF